MKAENYCMGCFKKREQGSVCPHCGYHHDTPPESPLYLTPGTTLHEKYMIGRVLGHGGFGITYLALDLNLYVKLVVKEYLPRDMACRAFNNTTVTPYTGPSTEHFEYGLKKFLEEARALARFEDLPGIVSVKDFFQANETAYFVMYFVEGITFKEYLKSQGGKIDYDKALRILMPVMDALREVHQTDLLHRDISPDNIYITQEGRIKLLDFGAARYASGEHSKSLSVMLKAGYAPEEQYRSKGKQGPWTDIYAVGATLYRAITGNVPLEALDRMDKDTIEPPSSLGIMIPPHAEHALLKAMSVKAGDRFQEMEKFQQALVREPEKIVGPDNENLVVQKQEVLSQNEEKEQAPPSRYKKKIWVVFSILLIIAIICVGKENATKDKWEPGIAHKECPHVVSSTAEGQWIPENGYTWIDKENSWEVKLNIVSSLTIVTDPPNAIVRIMNIEPKYQPGIELMPGRYQIEVTANGYNSYEESINIGPGEEKRIKIVLDKEKKQEFLCLEIIWNLYNIRYEGLMVLKENGGKFRVRCIDRTYERVYDIVDQTVSVQSVRDGYVLNCRNPISHSGIFYSADNFKFFNDGTIYMEDNQGVWSEDIVAHKIDNKNELDQMVRKYKF